MTTQSPAQTSTSREVDSGRLPLDTARLPAYHIARPSLMQKVLETDQACLIFGPLGSGKTVLLYEWLIAITQCSNTPTIYLASAATQSVQDLAHLETELLKTHAEFQRQHGSIELRRDVVLVIDGWPASVAKIGAPWLASQLASHPWLGAVITSRSGALLDAWPGTPAGSVNIISANALAFSEAESRSLFANLVGVEAAAGSSFSDLPYLTVRDARGHAEAPSAPTAHSRKLAQAFLLSTLDQCTERPLRDELIALCTLGSIEVRAARSTGAGAQALDRLEMLGLTVRDASGGRVLLQRSYAASIDDRLPGVSRADETRALTWYAERCLSSGGSVSAFEAFIVARATSRAERILLSLSPAEITRSLSEITCILSRLSSEDLAKRPVLCMLYASGLLRVPGKQHQAGALLNLVLSREQHHEEEAEDSVIDGQLPSQLFWHLTRMHAQRLGFLEGDPLREAKTIKEFVAKQRTTLLQEHPHAMIEGLERAAEVELLRDEPEAAVATVERLVPPMSAQSGASYGLGSLVCAEAYLSLGDRRRARHYAFSLDALREHGFNAHDHAHFALAVTHAVTELIEAQKYTEADSLLAAQADALETYDGVHLNARVRAALAICQGRAAETLIELQDFRERVQTSHPMNRYVFAAYRLAEAELTLACGQPRAAIRLMKSVASDLHRTDRNTFQARAALSRHDAERASSILADTPRPSAAHIRRRIEIALIQAAAQLDLGATRHARTSLQEAAYLVDRSDLTLPLVKLDLSSRNSLITFSETIDDPLMSSFRERTQGLPALFETLESTVCRSDLPDLTERERIVLSELAEARGPVEISQRLSVSVNTVKSQVRSLYRKLGVHTRDEAVSAAARFQLIDLPAR